MNKKYGEPISSVNGVFEIYKNATQIGDKYFLYKKTYIENKLIRIPYPDFFSNCFDSEEEALKYVSDIINKSWEKMMKIATEMHFEKNDR